MRSFVVVVAVVLGACGDDGGGTAIIMDVAEAAPGFGRAPWPTDAVREGDHLGVVAGLDQLAQGNGELIGRHLAALDGFGLRPAIAFFVDGALDPASLPASTTTALTEALVVVDLETMQPVPFDWRYDADRAAIAGAPRPGTQLREGARYAAIATTDVRAADGARLRPAAGLDVLAASAPARWQTTADAYAAANALPELAGRIAGIAMFTTEHASTLLVAARDVLATQPAPGLVFDDPAIIFDTRTELDRVLGTATRETTGPRAGLERWGTDNPTGIAHDHVGVLATGHMTIVRFRGDDTGTDGPEDETFQLATDGTPRPLATESIPVTFVLPKGPVPATGFPVVIFGHGLGGSRHAVLNLAEPLTSRGYAVVAIDMWGHGSRYADIDNGNNLAGKSAFTGDRALRDGFGDDPGYAAYIAFFEGFLNVAAIRDAILQSALDVSRLATLVHQPLDLGALRGAYGGTAPKLDARHVAYLGESFGTIVGTDVAAIEPSLDLFVLDVPGAGLLDQIMPNSAEIGSLALPLVQQIYRTRGTLDRFHPMIAAMQAVFDGSDPMTFAPHVLRDRFTIAGAPVPPRSVVAIEVIGDEIMANAGTSALATALGLGVLVPHLDPPPGLADVASPASGNVDGQTAVLVQYAPATHGFNWSAEHGDMKFRPGCPCVGDDPWPKLAAPVTLFEPIYETHEQVGEILDTHQAGATPVVRSTRPPVRDFDGDGRLDDVDPDPLDPAR
jgi:hypothetical protein